MTTQTIPQTESIYQTNTKLRLATGIMLSLLSGVMLTLSFAPYNIWPLIFVAFLPLIVARGFLLKDTPHETLLDTIQAAAIAIAAQKGWLA